MCVYWFGCVSALVGAAFLLRAHIKIVDVFVYVDVFFAIIVWLVVAAAARFVGYSLFGWQSSQPTYASSHLFLLPLVVFFDISTNNFALRMFVHM